MKGGLLSILFVATLLAENQSGPAAVVASLTGPATLKIDGAPAKAVHLFDWVDPGTTVEAGAGGRLVLAFANGRRYELGANAKLLAGKDGPKSTTGAVRELEPLPPMPLAGIQNQTDAAARSAAIRVRGSNAIKNLYPRQEFRALADHVVLLFSPCGAASYNVELEDESGNSIFHVQTASPKVNVPPGVLKPNTRYYWRVRAVGIMPRRGEAEFTTLSETEAAERAAFQAAVAQTDSDSLALIGMVDSKLGLLTEAREELRAALALSPENVSLRGFLHGIERQLDENDELH
jgi:hypothetical protein